MTELAWIAAGGLGMSGIALIGSVTFVLDEAARQRVILPLVAFSAGSLLGGALLHMIPEATARAANAMHVYVWVVAGFTLFLALEQFLHWHHWHQPESERKHPLGYVMLIGDSLHNFLGGVAVAGALLVDLRLGITTWLVAAAHEVPQELGKYGVLLHGGWSRGRALFLNWITSLTFLVGGVLAFALSFLADVTFLVPFAAGNFLYIAATDLVPEVNKDHRLATSALHFGAFAAGIAVLLAIKLGLGD